MRQPRRLIPMRLISWDGKPIMDMGVVELRRTIQQMHGYLREVHGGVADAERAARAVMRRAEKDFP